MPSRKANKTITRETIIRRVYKEMEGGDLPFPERSPAKYALIVMNELYLRNPENPVSKYYTLSTDAEITLFFKAWNEWRKKIIFRRKKLSEKLGYDLVHSLKIDALNAMWNENYSNK